MIPKGCMGISFMIEPCIVCLSPACCMCMLVQIFLYYKYICNEHIYIWIYKAHLFLESLRIDGLSWPKQILKIFCLFSDHNTFLRTCSWNISSFMLSPFSSTKSQHLQVFILCTTCLFPMCPHVCVVAHVRVHAHTHTHRHLTLSQGEYSSCMPTHHSQWFSRHCSAGCNQYPPLTS